MRQVLDLRNLPPPVVIRNLGVGLYEFGGVMHAAMLINGVPHLLTTDRDALHRFILGLADQIGRSGGPPDVED